MNVKKKDPITKDVNVPTSLNRLNEPKIRGQPWFLVVVWGLYFIASIFVSIILINLQVPGIPALLIPGTAFFLLAMATAGSRKQVLRSYHRALLLIRIFCKETVFTKYKMSLDDIKKWIPIESVEDSGLIRFTNGTSMIAFILDPPRNSTDEEGQYNTKIMNVINTIHGEYTYQFCAISLKEAKNHLGEATLESLNKDLKKASWQHMYSLYDHATNQKEARNIPDWLFVLFVALPVSKNIKDAERAKDALVSGLSKELERASILTNTVTGRTNCINLLRSTLTGEQS